MTYNVVFEYTDKAEAYEGTRTWTSFKDAKDFKKKYSPRDIEKVLKQGVTEQEAISLCLQGKSNLVAIAIQEATGLDGTFHPEIAELNLATNLVGKILMAQEQQKKSEEN